MALISARKLNSSPKLSICPFRMLSRRQPARLRASCSRASPSQCLCRVPLESLCRTVGCQQPWHPRLPGLGDLPRRSLLLPPLIPLLLSQTLLLPLPLLPSILPFLTLTLPLSLSLSLSLFLPLYLSPEFISSLCDPLDLSGLVTFCDIRPICLCLYLFLYIHTYIHVHVCIHVCMYGCMHARISTYAYTRINPLIPHPKP